VAARGISAVTTHGSATQARRPITLRNHLRCSGLAWRAELHVLGAVDRTTKTADVEQPEPGVLIWHTTSGRTYATAPTVYQA